ncbi:MAG: hypothetical protein IJ616_00805 [Bacteroidales bacterium]|jgi:predicted metal-binding protein|nr:hypothetical protein [Bacteroidales bacterium]
MPIKYKRDLDQCIKNYREAILAKEKDPDNEDNEIWESMAYCALEEAIEDRVRARMLASINSWLKGELPF